MFSKKVVWNVMIITAVMILTPSVRGIEQVSEEAIWTLLDNELAKGFIDSEDTLWVRPKNFQAVQLNAEMLDSMLVWAAKEYGTLDSKRSIVLDIPTPDGDLEHFAVVESSVMQPELEWWLADQGFPMRTYKGISLDYPATSVRLDWGGPAGFHAMILSPGRTYYVDPYIQGKQLLYASYFKNDYELLDRRYTCHVVEEASEAAWAEDISFVAKAGPGTGGNLRTYRLAVAATGEYTAFHGGTQVGGQAAIVTTINRVNQIYERDLSLRMILIGNNNLLVHVDADQDPYDNGDISAMLDQNQESLDLLIGDANYDIGHVVGTQGGGRAEVGVACRATRKARGGTASNQPVGDPFDIDYVAHELGHQWGAHHTFNSEASYCGGGRRDAQHAYEPGSGSTVMAYAGICEPDNLQPHSDDFFHGTSLDEILAYVAGDGACSANVDAGNPNGPTIDTVSNYTIPIGTAFELAPESASDADDDFLTFSWEEFDLGSASSLSMGDNGSSPLFRAQEPSLCSIRVFPKKESILSGTTTPGEILPVTNRAMTFRVTVRDNRSGGGRVGEDVVVVNSSMTSGPFKVISPNGGENWQGVKTVTWNVANTNAGAVASANVDILLSLDGGGTWPLILLSQTPNDGSASIVLPAVSTSIARIKIRGSGNVFFDVSDADFAISGGTCAFSDIEAGDWFEGYVAYACERNIVNGYQDGTYRPEIGATRAEILKIAYEAAGQPVSCPAPDPGFVDVLGGEWYYNYVADARGKGFVGGESCGGGLCFFPNSLVNRAEALKIISEIFGINPENAEDFINVNESERIAFPDVPSMEWFYPYVNWMANAELATGSYPNGIVAGERIVSGYPDGLFRPAGSVNRAEVAKIVANLQHYFSSGSSPLSVSSRTWQAGFTRAKISARNVSAGYLYEQSIDPTNSNAPTPFTLPGGNEQTTTGPVNLAGATHDVDGDLLFYFWTATGGSFTTSNPANFSSVTWTPPAVTQATTFIIDVVRGDRRGKVGSGQLVFTVPGSGGGGQASGTVTAPNGTQTGNVTVSANVTDPDGLERVTVTFVPGGLPLVLCGTGGTSSCAGTTQTLTRSNVNPSIYGASGGAVTLRLFVEDSLGNNVQVDSHAFTWNPGSPGSGHTLTVIKLGDGDGTVSGEGISCGPGCTSTSANYNDGDTLTLTGSGDQFIGFMGDRCYGLTPCAITMSSNFTVYASFALPDSFGVEYTYPISGNTGVATSTQPAVIFNRDIAPGPNFSSLSFRKCDGTALGFNPVVGSGTHDERLTFVLDNPMARGTCHVAEVPAGSISDLDGNPLAAPVSFTFTTEEDGTPKMYVSAYPVHVLEGNKTKLSIWFETPVDYVRTLTLTSTPSGTLIHPSSVELPAGEVLVELEVDSAYNHGSLNNVNATIQVQEASAGTLSENIIVVNDTDRNGVYLTWQAAGLVDDDDGDGIFESGESAQFLFEVVNSGSQGISNVVLEFSVADTYNMSILGGSPYTCNLGYMAPGQSRGCTRWFRADDDLPTGTYHINIHGTGTVGSTVDHMYANTRVNVVNNDLPDFAMNVSSFPSSPAQPGTQRTARYTPRNNGNGFDLRLPQFEVFIVIDGQEHLLYRTYADVRGDFSHSQTFNLPITVPDVPGSHQIRARINPTGVIPESNYGNNAAAEITLNVAEPNQPPALPAIIGPLTLNIGESLAFVVTATDPNNDPLTYSLGSGAPAGLSIHPSTGLLTWTPACATTPQIYNVEVQVADSAGQTDSGTIVIDVRRQADLGISKTSTFAAALPGETIDFTIEVSNNGPSCVTGATVSDVFTADLTEISWTCSASSGSSCTAGAVNGNIADHAVDLLDGGTAIYTVSAKIVETATGLVSNQASVTAPAGASDPNLANNVGATSISLRGLDFGDAADSSIDAAWSFPTRLVDDGARHGIDPFFVLGLTIDGENDGQPSDGAVGDDLAGADDESGVVFLTPMASCEQVDLEVTASAAGFLDAWVDFNGDGDWGDAGEQVFASQGLVAGVNALSFVVPCSAVPAEQVFLRFRLSSTGGLSYSGLALDGEVEDYALPIRGFDFGDAPAGYPTLRADDGPRHLLTPGGPVLGQRADAEIDGLPGANADGDDLDGAFDDEDGIAFTSLLVPGAMASLTATVTAPARLDAWIDFNGDGDWVDAGEQIFANQAVPVVGANLLAFPVAAAAVPGLSTFGRFRLSSTGGLSSTGPASDGEVEDHRVTIAEIADLNLILTDTPDPLPPGNPLTYTLTVTNLGPSASTGSQVTDMLPAGLSFVSSPDGCTASGNPVMVTCPFGPLAAGSGVSLGFTVSVAGSMVGSLSNTATVTGQESDPVPGNNSASATTQVENSPPVLDPVGGPFTVETGELLSFTVTASDPNGDGLTFSLSSAPTGAAIAPSSGVFTWTPTAAQGGQTYVFDVVVTDDDPSDPRSDSETIEIEVTVPDADPPTVVRVDTLAATAGGELSACETVHVEVNEILVTFNEALYDPPGDVDPDDVTNPDNYLLLAAGPDQDFDTDLCGTLFGDDVPIALDSVTWDVASLTATLKVTGEPLGDAPYRMIACGSTSLYDLAGNPLDGNGDGIGGDDFLMGFRVDAGNTFDNGHLDCGFEPWLSTSTNPAEITFSSEDVDGSAVSGSVHLQNLTSSTDFTVSQCVSIAGGGRHGLSAKLRFAAGPGASASLGVSCDYFDQPACMGNSLGLRQKSLALAETAGQWLDIEAFWVSPVNGASALCTYRLTVPGGDSFEAYLDDLGLRNHESLFSDGFESGDTSAWGGTGI